MNYLSKLGTAQFIRLGPILLVPPAHSSDFHSVHFNETQFPIRVSKSIDPNIVIVTCDLQNSNINIFVQQAKYLLSREGVTECERGMANQEKSAFYSLNVNTLLVDEIDFEVILLGLAMSPCSM